MMKKLFILTFTLIIAIAGSEGMKADPPKKQPSHRVTPLMKMKLERSKAILEGLTLEDFDAIAKNARALKLLSLESGWKVIQTEKYVVQSQDFRQAADIITDAAAEKDISRATLGYVKMTVRCVECHSYMRKQRIELN
ncbi:MAG: hypothetical protein HKN47_10920 [Pirellulaceae bacterium]|nr:hypothetical protein [Pirellulaceae bacterium]